MYLVSLSHVAEQNTPHTLDCTLLHLVGTPLVITNLPTESKTYRLIMQVFAPKAQCLQYLVHSQILKSTLDSLR